ncbi:MAG TPA: DUF2721 domain-containing protein [Verrucomicrobiae bacterium]|jgi:hypothetical protein
MPASLDQIIPELRDAVGPVILISGVGLLLLTMTNRLGRAIDRARQLKVESKHNEHGHAQEQIAIIYRRAKLIRLSIILAATSALLAALLIITVFVAAVLQWNSGIAVSVLFIGSMLSLSVSLVAFICDINLSLRALKLDLENPKKAGR